MIDQRARDGHALLLAARKLRGEMFQAVSQANAAQGFGGLVLIGDAMEILCEHDVFKRREIWHEMKLLENETDFLGAIAGQLALAELADLHAIHHHTPSGGVVEASENIDQRRFAGPRWPHDGNPLAGLDLKTYVIESADSIETLFELFDLDQRRHHSPRNISAGRMRPSSRSGSAPVSATATAKTMVTGKTARRGEMETPKTRPPIHCASTTPIANPTVPPTTPSAAASARNRRMIRSTDPPSAFIKPTSRLRSIARAAIDASTPSVVRTRMRVIVQKIRPRIRARIDPSAAASWRTGRTSRSGRVLARWLVNASISEGVPETLNWTRLKRPGKPARLCATSRLVKIWLSSEPPAVMIPLTVSITWRSPARRSI